MTDGERLDHLTLIMKASKEEMADEIIRLRRENRELKERLGKDMPIYPKVIKKLLLQS